MGNYLKYKNSTFYSYKNRYTKTHLEKLFITQRKNLIDFVKQYQDIKPQLMMNKKKVTSVKTAISIP